MSEIIIKQQAIYDTNKDPISIKYKCLIFGSSNAVKPAYGYFLTGSKYIELDTGKTYLYDEEIIDWVEQPSSGGGEQTSHVEIVDELPATGDSTKLYVLKTDHKIYIYNNNEWQVVGGEDLLTTPFTFIYDDNTTSEEKTIKG